MTVYEMCKKYYPKYWDKVKIDALYEKGLLIDAECNDVIGA